MPAVADLALTQTDQTIVIIAAAEGLLLEQESWAAMDVITFQHITGKNRGNAGPYNDNYARWSMCHYGDSYRHFVEANATAFVANRN